MAKSIRKDDPETVIAVATAFDSIDFLKRTISLRLDGFITKSVSPGELKNVLKMYLQKVET